MKTLFFVFTFIVLSIVLMAQDDCMYFFPSDKGTVLVTKNYDAKGNLLSTMTYMVNKMYQTVDGSNIEIVFTIINSKDSLIDSGILNARCDDGTFYMTMSNRILSPDAIKMLEKDTELVGDFLDYPDSFGDDFSDYNNGDFKMSGGKFTIQSKKDKKIFAHIDVFGRQYEKNEKITTPAGTFDAAKVTFNFTITENKKKTAYKGVEWYAVNAGIIRSETYDKKGNLQNYSVLTMLKTGEE